MQQVQRQSKDQQCDRHLSVFWLEQQVGMHQILWTCRSQAWEMGNGNWEQTLLGVQKVSNKNSHQKTRTRTTSQKKKPIKNERTMQSNYFTTK
jgi:hypothetical protein